MARRILIVDDQEDILLILEREFRRVPGFSVSSTSKTENVLPLIAEKQVNLVISDVRLGKESGFDLVREINRTYSGVGTILMSAYRSASNKQQAADLGVLLFLEKPFQVSKLIEAVTGYFERLETPAPAPAAEEPTDFSQQTNSLIHFKLQDLVQLFCLNGRNILISVKPGLELPEGEIYIQRGRLIHVDYDGRTGDEAFLELMQLHDPLLSVKDWTALVPVTVQSRWEQLLLQSAIHSDHRLPGEQVRGTG